MNTGTGLPRKSDQFAPGSRALVNTEKRLAVLAAHERLCTIALRQTDSFPEAALTPSRIITLVVVIHLA